MPRKGVQYIQNEEPSFIKQFKQRIGYKEGPDINAKRGMTEPDRDDDDEENELAEREDEKPVVVVLRDGDLTSDQVETELKNQQEGPANLDDKIVFKKPTKRQMPSEGEKQSLTEEHSTKKKKSSGKSDKHRSKTSSHSLLSFGDEEDEEES